MLTEDNGLEVLDVAECRRLLTEQSFGRVGVCVGALPAIFPVNYRVVGNMVVFRTAVGTKLWTATDRAVVAFEIDETDAFQQEGWSVLVVGTAVHSEDESIAEFVKPWPAGHRNQVVGIPIEVISGRRIRYG